MGTLSKRLGHKKSRNGCLRCKARHVKCDEQRPCTACVRFGIVCSLTLPPDQQPVSTRKISPASDNAASKHRTAGLSPSSSGLHGRGQEPVTPQEDSLAPTPGPSIVAPTLGAPSPSTSVSWPGDQQYSHFSVNWMQSLRLVHHYSTVVCYTISHSSFTENLWKTTVPQTAFSHEFLMHGLLAVSALNYAHSNPDERDEYILISTHYQNLALQYFTTKLGNINEENFEPVFFLATFIFIWNLCSFSDTHHAAKPVTTAEIAQSFRLLHGIKSICDSRPRGWIEAGPLAPLFQQWDHTTKSERTGAFHMQMNKLYDLARDLNPSFEVINTQSCCILAIESLRTTYSACLDEKSEQRTQRIWFWPITLTQVFIDLINTNHPVALIILGHYAALARTYEKWNWINVGWSAKAMHAVEAALDKEWHEWIAWPMRSIRECIDVYEMVPHDV